MSAVAQHRPLNSAETLMKHSGTKDETTNPFELGSATFQRQLSIPFEGGKSIKTSFPGVIVAAASNSKDGQSSDLQIFLNSTSQLAAQPEGGRGGADKVSILKANKGKAILT